jgi:cytochrome b6-f complex iron-sulfur subunit
MPDEPKHVTPGAPAPGEHKAPTPAGQTPSMPVGPQSEPKTSAAQIPPDPGVSSTPPPSTAPPATATTPAAPARPVSPAAAAAAHAATRPAPAPRPAAPAGPPPDVAGKLTTPAATAAKRPAAATAAKDEDDSSPLMGRRAWIGVAWGAFTAASVAALAATGRFMFPNVINEPPAQFKIGFPAEYGMGVDERFKETMGVWIVRTPQDMIHNTSGFYALLTTCTHLGCTPNFLSAENKFKCPCHGSGFRPTGINFEGPAPRPLERARIVLAEDGQILVDKSRKFQWELGQWIDPEAFLPA